MKTVELAIARKQLESLMGSELGQLDPDAIDACIPDLRWESLPNDGLSDAKTATAIGLLGDTSISEFTFVTDASFAAGVGAFIVERSELSDFFALHVRDFKERVFSGGDVIIWSRDSGKMWICHHEGVFATTTIIMP